MCLCFIFLFSIFFFYCVFYFISVWYFPFFFFEVLKSRSSWLFFFVSYWITVWYFLLTAFFCINFVLLFIKVVCICLSYFLFWFLIRTFPIYISFLSYHVVFISGCLLIRFLIFCISVVISTCSFLWFSFVFLFLLFIPLIVFSRLFPMVYNLRFFHLLFN